VAGMPDTWIIDITHYLDASGRLAAMPGPARRIADYFGSIVAALADTIPETVTFTSVQCRRRPGRRRCLGQIQGVVNSESAIRWQCPVCADNGLISHWQGTIWDTRRSGPLQ
jgi:hypothetical protein